jgi:hypothetical protein
MVMVEIGKVLPGVVVGVVGIFGLWRGVDIFWKNQRGRIVA